jgi:LAO/AO transport system kinase
MDLAEAVLAGDRLSLARLLTQVENDTPSGRSALDRLFPATGRAHLIGVTGSPGTGKSSLVNRLAQAFRRGGGDEPACRVAIVAVDPTSPFSGGALLGDRVRMRDLSGDPGVFIRSMAARGALGGLARATAGVVQVLDAAGFEMILIETVGAGQSEVDIARLAHTTLVVEAPGMGDEIQAIKAGILEIADILVVNKADRPGVENTERALRAMLEMGHPAHKGRGPAAESEELWLPPVQRAISTNGEGVAEIVRAIRQHAEYLRRSGEWRRREYERMQNVLEMLVQQTLVARWRAGVSDEQLDAWVVRLCERGTTPYAALEELLTTKN